MASAVLTTSSRTASFVTQTGVLYSLGITGTFGGGGVSLTSNLDDSPLVFGSIGAGVVRSEFFRNYRAGGPALSVKLNEGDGTSSVNIQLTPVP